MTTEETAETIRCLFERMDSKCNAKTNVVGKIYIEVNLDHTSEAARPINRVPFMFELYKKFKVILIDSVLKESSYYMKFMDTNETALRGLI